MKLRLNLWLPAGLGQSEGVYAAEVQ